MNSGQRRMLRYLALLIISRHIYFMEGKYFSWLIRVFTCTWKMQDSGEKLQSSIWIFFWNRQVLISEL